jgi:hypothetical protein
MQRTKPRYDMTPVEEIPLDGLMDAFEAAIRNLSVDDRRLIWDSPEPQPSDSPLLSRAKTIRLRMKREASQYGVEYSRSKNGIMHHPV